MPITESQRRQLKKLVHHLKPVVSVGQNGLTEGVINEVGTALDTHELIKVRLYATGKEEKRSLLEEICRKTDAELIHSIGHVAAFYRKHPKKPKIILQS